MSEDPDVLTLIAEVARSAQGAHPRAPKPYLPHVALLRALIGRIARNRDRAEWIAIEHGEVLVAEEFMDRFFVFEGVNAAEGRDLLSRVGISRSLRAHRFKGVQHHAFVLPQSSLERAFSAS